MQSINDILEKFSGRLEAHRLAPGDYCRYLWQKPGGSRQMGSNAYGCADAANLLYTLGRFPGGESERAAFVAGIRKFQDPETGHFLDPTHVDTHTTAHCIAALELFEARPLHPLHALGKYRDVSRFITEMEQADFLHCGKMAHFGAGLFAALFLTGEVGEEWIRRYFAWMDACCDPETGMWVRRPTRDFPVHIQMGDAFHFLFHYEHWHHAIPYPDRLIDSCLAMYRDGSLPPLFGRQFHFIEMDWVYCLSRASRSTPHRFYEVRETLAEFSDAYLSYLRGVDYETDEGANDLHLLFGACCCLAELQAALPDRLPSAVPLRLVLDRRPFI